MSNAPKETLLIAIMTAILGGIMVLRNISAIIHQIRKILDEYTEFWRLRNEKQRQEIEERRLRIEFWSHAIQIGTAENKLRELEKGIDKKWEQQ